MAVSLDEKFIETSEAILSQLGFRDIKSFVNNQTLLLMLAKIDKYQSEERFFERKYGVSFEESQGRIEGPVRKEVFEGEDDYLDWRFAREALDHLRRQKQDLERA